MFLSSTVWTIQLYNTEYSIFKNYTIIFFLGRYT